RVGVSAELSQRLRQVAQQHGLTMNTLLQGAWAVLLSRYSGSAEVVFGVTVSGRPAQLEGVEQMVGLFINTLPVRVQVRGEQEVMGWLEQVQRQQVEMRQYEYSSLAQVQKWWQEVGGAGAKFDSILVYENYPVDESVDEQGWELGVSEVENYGQTNYGVNLIAGMGKRLWLRVSYGGRRYEREGVERLPEQAPRAPEG